MKNYSMAMSTTDETEGTETVKVPALVYRSPVLRDISARLIRFYNTLFSKINITIVHLVVLCICVFLLFWPARKTFFVGDDFGWLLRASTTLTTFGDWFHVFTHLNYANTFRPLSQEVYFYFCWKVFGPNPLGYHLVLLLAFLVSVVFLYLFLHHLSQSAWIALGAATVWAFSSTHLDSLNWVSAFTETSAVMFSLIALFAVTQKKAGWATVAFVLALLCDESTIVLPALITLVYLLNEGTDLVQTARSVARYWITLVGYILYRVLVVGLVASGPHQLNLSPALSLALTGKAIQWSFGVVDAYTLLLHVGGPLWPRVAHYAFLFTLLCWGLFVVLFVIHFVRKQPVDYKGWSLFLLGVGWFLISMVPIVVFTASDFVQYNMSLPLIGVSICIVGLARLVPSWGRFVSIALGIAYLVLNLTTMYAPAGVYQDDFTMVLARASSDAYTQVAAAAAVKKAPLTVVVERDPQLAYLAQWTIYTNDMVSLIDPGSVVCYGDGCPATPDVEFRFESGTWHYVVIKMP